VIAHIPTICSRSNGLDKFDVLKYKIKIKYESHEMWGLRAKDNLRPKKIPTTRLE
jgi:hypothetical protein